MSKKVYSFRLDEKLIEELRKKKIDVTELIHEAMRQKTHRCPLCGSKKSSKNKSL